jgi:hypothetical protein
MKRIKDFNLKKYPSNLELYVEHNKEDYGVTISFDLDYGFPTLKKIKTKLHNLGYLFSKKISEEFMFYKNI